MKFNKDLLFGVILMIAGSFISSSGLTDNNFAYTTVGLVMIGFAVFLWTTSTGEDN